MTSLIHYLPFVGSFIKNLDEDIKKNGLSNGFHHSLLRTKSKLEVYGQNASIKKILQNKPVVVIANHPNQSDIFPLIASLPARRDSFLVAINQIMGISSRFDQYIVPVFIKHFRPFSIKEKIMDHLLTIFHPTPTFSSQDAHRKNILSIKKCSKMVENGGLVAIFPESRQEKNHWKAGIGYLLKNIKRKDVYIVLVYIEGTSYFDYLRFFPWIGKILPTVKVYFSSPKLAYRIINQDFDAKDIVENLENKYSAWKQMIE